MASVVGSGTTFTIEFPLSEGTPVGTVMPDTRQPHEVGADRA